MGGGIFAILRIASAWYAINFSKFSRCRGKNLQWRNAKWCYTFVASLIIFAREQALRRGIAAYYSLHPRVWSLRYMTNK